jgi:hypothetical protein
MQLGTVGVGKVTALAVVTKQYSATSERETVFMGWAPYR